MGQTRYTSIAFTPLLPTTGNQYSSYSCKPDTGPVPSYASRPVRYVSNQVLQRDAASVHVLHRLAHIHPLERLSLGLWCQQPEGCHERSSPRSLLGFGRSSSFVWASLVEILKAKLPLSSDRLVQSSKAWPRPRLEAVTEGALESWHRLQQRWQHYQKGGQIKSSLWLTQVVAQIGPCSRQKFL